MTLVLAALCALAVATPAWAQTVTVNSGNGSITISNAEKDAKYSIYKLFDATVGTDGSIAYSTSKDVSEDTVFNKYFEIKNGNIVKKDALTADVLKSDEFKTWAQSFGTIVGSETTATESSLKFDKIPFGYYFVKSSLGTVLSVDSTNPNAEVIDKNEKPSFDKNIVDDPEAPVKVNEAGLNEDIKFDITTKAKNYDGEDKIFKYVIYDTMDHGFSLSSVPVVKVDGTELANDKYGITYKKWDSDSSALVTTTTATEADYFEIVIPWTSDGTKAGTFLYDANAVINVTYTAKLDPTKAAQVTTGATPNKNIADVKYYKGNDNPEGNTPSGDLPDKQTDTYDTQVTVKKVDGSKNNAALTGAQFTLTTTDGTKVAYTVETKYTADDAGTYYKLKDGTYTSEAPNGNATHDAAYDSTETKYKMETEAKVMGKDQTPSSIAAYVGADGTVSFTGLGVGTYKLEETVVPAGFNKADDIEFTITFNATSKAFASSNTNVKLTGEATNVFETTVVNNKGTELPSTGGMGTTILYTVGGILIAAGGIWLVTKKRLSAME